ncbi:DUF6745 domain-containing protein [Actinoallomurus rhizosphaericola]|uniref:DUF6745 domain-containing protein n=1 Tax=Actinoallomurus rhizosphaericola TaxID=2952536 RepID=UPI002092336D|nr:hypothetical protein [Actinoallomurus rhizosphaericola]MCO5999041.1 hypothetical protein [Actinoallomurus rhizosphaericola]
MNTLMTQDWRSVAFATGPADRERAEAGIRAAYAAAGLTGPERFVWAPSPAFGAVAAVLLDDPGHAERLRQGGLGDQVDRVGAALGTADAGRSVRDAVRTRPWEAARTAARAGLSAQEWSAAWARTGGDLWRQVDGLVVRIRRGLGELAAGEAEALLREATLDAVLGQHDAPWLALFDAVGGLADLTGLAETAQAAGWWWPYEGLAIVCDRPSELHRDEPGRLHRGDGPALSYPDGFALHAWRGMPIPADFIGTLTGLTAERIAAEENAELRRVMLENFGYDRYLAETGARPVHRDETGVLWRIDLPGDEPVAMVEVVNSTPEPDGTSRTYYLRVPPGTRTAREGVAWTFGLTEQDYQPVRQT